MKFILTFTLGILTFFGFSQNIWIADNRPTAPTGAHVFANVTDAITAASPGDIIHVIPSQTTYPNFSIGKDSLTFFGIGFNPDKDQPNKVWVDQITILHGAFGIRISGVNVTSAIIIGENTTGSLGNIFIENGDINRIDGQNGGFTTISNLVIRNCILGNRETSSQIVVELSGNQVSATSVVITNCIISGTTFSSSYGSIGVTDAIIKNNIFLGDGTSDIAFSNVTTSTISNNIFTGRWPTASTSITNSTFTNNITTNAGAIPIGTSGNTGAGNLEGTNPMLINVPPANRWSFSYDPTPDPAGPSPAIGAGNDLNDIGVTGGTIPFSKTGTPLPVIKVLRVPEVIKQGTNLSATIEAVGN